MEGSFGFSIMAVVSLLTENGLETPNFYTLIFEILSSKPTLADMTDAFY